MRVDLLSIDVDDERNEDMLYRDKFLRVLSLAVYLADGRYHKVWDVMNKFAVSKATANRDLATLESISIAIERDRQKGIRLMPDSRVFIPQLQPEEAIAMQIAIQGLPVLPRLPLAEHGNTGWGKVLASLSERLKTQVRSTDTGILSFTDAPLQKEIRPEIFQGLVKAISEHQRITISYGDHKSANTERKLDPCRIIIAKGRLFLFAFCFLRKEFRIFRLDRVLTVRACSEKVNPCREQEAEELLAAAWGVEIKKPRLCRMIFYGDSARAAEERLWHASQVCCRLPNGSMEFTVTTGSTVEIGRWLLSFGGDVEVVEPLELKEWYRGQVEAMWERLNAEKAEQCEMEGSSS